MKTMIASKVVAALLIATHVYSSSIESRENICDGQETGTFLADPNDPSKYYQCVNGNAMQQSCPAGLVFDESISNCNWPSAVGTTESEETKTTVATKPTQGTTMETTTSITSEATSPNGGTTTTALTGKSTFPKHIMSLYLLLADDTTTHPSSKQWTPVLYEYQREGFNLLFLTFINPKTMEVPYSFKEMVKQRDSGDGINKDTKIVFAIGGIGYCEGKWASWEWLKSKTAAESMAERVAEWSTLGADGVDLDIEGSAGNQPGAPENLGYFLDKLRQLWPSAFISQPVYGWPQVAAETYVVNQSWDVNGKHKTGKGFVDGVGLMTYATDLQSLDYVEQYTDAAPHTIPPPNHVTANVPNSAIILGCSGGIAPGSVSTLTQSVIDNGYLGIMVWVSSVKDAAGGKGLYYWTKDQLLDTSSSSSAFVKGLEALNSAA